MLNTAFRRFKPIFLFIVLYACVGMHWVQAAVTNSVVEQIGNIVSKRLSWENYWTGNWILNKRRELRAVEVRPGFYFAIYQSFSNDWSGLNLPDWQVAFISFDSAAPELTFIVGLDDVKNLDLSSEGVSRQTVINLISGDASMKGHFVVKQLDLRVPHDAEWNAKISSLKEAISSEISSLKIEDCTVIFFDLFDSVERIEGLVLVHDDLVYDLNGEMLLDNKEKKTYYCSMRSRPLDQVDVWKIRKILQSPVIFKVTNKNNQINVTQVRGF